MAYYVGPQSIVGIYVKLATSECYVKIDSGVEIMGDGGDIGYLDMSDTSSYVELVGDELFINVQPYRMVDKLPEGFVEVLLDDNSRRALLKGYV